MVSAGELVDDPGGERFFAFGVDCIAEEGAYLVGGEIKFGGGNAFGFSAGGNAEVDFSGFGVGGDGRVFGIHEFGEFFPDDGFGDSHDAKGATVEGDSGVDSVECVFNGAV